MFKLYFRSCNEDVTTLDKPLNLSSAQYHKQLLSMPEEKEIEEMFTDNQIVALNDITKV